MKLTDSAHRAIEELLKFKNSRGSQPSISFHGNEEGEIRIPGRSNSDGATFRFQVQRTPQASFECIHQDTAQCLESLGPMMSKLRIQGKEDSYSMTRRNIENAKAQSEKNSVKEFKPNNLVTRVRPVKNTTPNVPSMKDVRLPNASLSASGSLFQGHRNNLSHKVLPSLMPTHSQNGRKPVSVELQRRSLRERVIHFLAVKPRKKFEVMNRIAQDEERELDRNQVCNVLQRVSCIKENTCVLLKHMWSEVNDDWPFYTEEERQKVRQNRCALQAQSSSRRSSPQLDDEQSSLCSASVSPGGQLKRHGEIGSDSTVMKKSRLVDTQVSRPADSTSSSLVRPDTSYVSGYQKPVHSKGRMGVYGLERAEKCQAPTNGYSPHMPATSVSPATSSASPSFMLSPAEKHLPCGNSSISPNSDGVRVKDWRRSKQCGGDRSLSDGASSACEQINIVESSSVQVSPDSQLSQALGEITDHSQYYIHDYERQFPPACSEAELKHYRTIFRNYYKNYDSLKNDVQEVKNVMLSLCEKLKEKGKKHKSPEYLDLVSELSNLWRTNEFKFQLYNRSTEFLQHLRDRIHSSQRPDHIEVCL